MSSLSNSKVTLVDHEGDAVSVSDAGNLMVDIGAASISGDLSVNLTEADKVSIWGNEQADGAGTARAVLVDSSGHLQVDVANIPTVNLSPVDNAVLDSIDAGVNPAASVTEYAQFDVDTIAIQLSSADGINAATTGCKEIIIQCDFDNTGYVMVGGSPSVACDSRGIRLEAGDTLTLSTDATADVYLIASANDQMVNVVVLK